MSCLLSMFCFTVPAPTDTYAYGPTLSLHDALPISGGMRSPLDMGCFPIITAAPGSYPTVLATVEQAASNGVPIGSVVDFAGTTAPTGYLLCYGQAIGRSEYSDQIGRAHV